MNDFEASLVTALRAEVEQVVGFEDDTRAVQRLESGLDRVDHARRRRIWVTMAAVGAAAAVISVIALADRATDHALPLPPIGPSPSTSAVTSPAPAGTWGTGPVGTTFTFTSADGATYGVTLTKVTVDAKGADATTTPDPGNRFVQAEFTIKGVTGTSTRDANKMAELVSVDRHRYQPDLSVTKGCTNFESGNFAVAEGAQATGCVTFQLFADLRLAEIGWTDLSSSDPPATWVIQPTPGPPDPTGPQLATLDGLMSATPPPGSDVVGHCAAVIQEVYTDLESGDLAAMQRAYAAELMPGWKDEFASYQPVLSSAQTRSDLLAVLRTHPEFTDAILYPGFLMVLPQTPEPARSVAEGEAHQLGVPGSAPFNPRYPGYQLVFGTTPMPADKCPWVLTRPTA